MKGIKNNKKGFTLIELLAVIVVLAIVMVLATTTVLPLMNDAKKNSFAIEATDAINAASTLVTILPLNTAANLDKYRDTNGNPKTDTKADFNMLSDGGKRGYCFSLKLLVDTGIYKKDMSYFTGATPEYEGRVIVIENLNNNQYTYKLDMHNANFEITGGKTSSYGGKDVNPKGTNTAGKYTCIDANFKVTDLA